MSITNTYLNYLVARSIDPQRFDAEYSINRSLFYEEINQTTVSNFFKKGNRNISDPREIATGRLGSFLSETEYNLTNKFEVYIQGPNLADFGYPGDPYFWASFRYLAEAVELPRKSLNMNNYQLNALPITPIPFQLNYENILTITFRMQRNYAQRDAFLKWQELIAPSLRTPDYNKIKTDNNILEANSGVNYYDVYAKDFEISVATLNTQGQTNMLTKFYGVFPYSVEPLSYDWGSSEYVRQVVNFSFNKFHTVTHTTGA